MFLYYGKNQESKVISNIIGYCGIRASSDFVKLIKCLENN